MSRPDLDAPEHIDGFVDQFYQRVLADPMLAPLFLEVAGVNLDEHLPRIKAYWRKMLLGDPTYRRHMMQRHRDLDNKLPLRGDHYQQWLAHFETTLQKSYSGPVAERALTLGRRIAGNMRRNLEAGRAKI